MTKKAFLPVFLLIITLNGWATGRFSVYINGQKSGEILIERKTENNRVITKTTEKLALKRGYSTIETETVYLCVEKKDGTPVELKVKNIKGNTSIFPRYTVKFGREIKLILPGGTKTIPGEIKRVRQDYGEEILLKKMIEKNIKKLTYSKFDPSIFNLDTITARYLGKEKKGYRFRLKSSALNVTEERLVDRNGEMLSSSMEFAGMKFKVVKSSLEKEDKKIKPAQLLTPSLIFVPYFFPRGYTVSSIKYILTNKSEYNFSALKSENQIVNQTDKKSCTLTVVKTRIPQKITPDREEGYLKSSYSINLSNPRLKEIVKSLEGKSKDNYGFIKNTLDFVYNYIESKNFDNIMANTDTILKERKGDCTEHSFLTTAILRKKGIPARCVMGLVMGDNIFGYHMWVEVKVNGKWFGIDPTFNQINPDPTHIKLGVFSDNPDGISVVYKKIIPLINSLSIKPVEIKFENGKKIENPESFFKTLFNGGKWGFDTNTGMYYLSGKEGIFDKEVYLFSLLRKDPKILAVKLSFFNRWKNHYTQEIKGKQVLVFMDRGRFAFSFVHNSVFIIFVARSNRPVKIEKLKDFCYNKCVEVIDRCQKKF